MKGGLRVQSIVREANEAGHIMSLVRKQRAMAVFTQLMSSFMCSRTQVQGGAIFL